MSAPSKVRGDALLRVFGGNATPPVVSNVRTQANAFQSGFTTRNIIKPKHEKRKGFDNAGAFTLPDESLNTDADDSTVQLRYTLLPHDRAWLTAAMQQNIVPRTFDDVALASAITAFEIAAFNKPQLSLERVEADATSLTAAGLVMSSTLHNHVRDLWVTKRSTEECALLPELQSWPVEGVGTGDEPFMSRESEACHTVDVWRIVAKPNSTADHATERANALVTMREYLDVAIATTRGLRRREELRLRHSHLSVYEMALIRVAAGSGEGGMAEQQMDVPVTPATAAAVQRRLKRVREDD
jgi:hypothetical protein